MIATNVEEAMNETARRMKAVGWTAIRLNRRDEAVIGYRVLKGVRYQITVFGFVFLFVATGARVVVRETASGWCVWNKGPFHHSIPNLLDIV